MLIGPERESNLSVKMIKKVELSSRSQHVNHHPLQTLLNLVAITTTCMQRNMSMHASWNTIKVNIIEHKKTLAGEGTSTEEQTIYSANLL